MGIKNENFTLSLVYMTECYKKPKWYTYLFAKTHSRSKILPECWWFYTSAASDACDKYHVCMNILKVSQYIQTCSGGDDRPNWVPCGTCSWLCPNCHSGKMQTFRLDQLFVSNKFWIVFHTITATGEFLQDTKKALKYQSKARRVRKIFKIHFCLER